MIILLFWNFGIFFYIIFFPFTCKLVCHGIPFPSLVVDFLSYCTHLSTNSQSYRKFPDDFNCSLYTRRNWHEQKYISYEVQNFAFSIYSEVFWKTSDNFPTLSAGTFMSVATQSLPRPFIFRRIFHFEAIAIYRVGVSKQKPSTIFMKWKRYMYVHYIVFMNIEICFVNGIMSRQTIQIHCKWTYKCCHFDV